MANEDVKTGFFSKSNDLKNRIIFTIFILSIYRLGTYIPLPGIDPQALQSLMESNQRGLLGMFNIFSGGAVRGAAQIGMLKALCEAGIKPDAVVGVSIGALNGFWFSCNPTLERVNELERLWQDIVEDPPISGNVLRRITSILRGKPSFDTGEKLRLFLEENVPSGDLGETEIPFHLGTTSASTGLIKWWDEGPSVDLLLASAALPGLLPAVHLDDSGYHLDGGIVSNIPLRKAISLK